MCIAYCIVCTPIRSGIASGKTALVSLTRFRWGPLLAVDGPSVELKGGVGVGRVEIRGKGAAGSYLVQENIVIASPIPRPKRAWGF